MRIKKKRFLGILFSLALMLGLMFGMSVTAYAANETTPYLTFTGTDAFSIKTGNNKANWDGTLEYSTDASTWTTWNGRQINSENNVLYFRGTGNTKIAGSQSAYRWIITTQGTVACSGDIILILNKTL